MGYEEGVILLQKRKDDRKDSFDENNKRSRVNNIEL